MPLSPSKRDKLLADAHRETVEGMTVLHLSGTPYAIGVQQGVLRRDDIAVFRRAAYDYLCGEVARILRLPRTLAWLMTRPLLLWQARARQSIPFPSAIRPLIYLRLDNGK
jgi:hypothetical protein